MIVKQQQHGHFSSHEEQLKRLIKTRKEIVDKMSQLTKRRFFLQAQPRNKTQNGQSPQHDGQPRKITKMDSKQSLDNNLPHKDTRIRSSNSLGSQDQQNQTVKKMKSEAAQRNKRMFQGLNTYLDKAKNKLQQEKTKREQTNKIIEKIQQKQKEKSQQLLKQEVDRINIQYAQHQKQKDQNSKQILKIQNLILLKNYTQYANAIKPFIFTRTQPSISWKPTKDIPKQVPKDMEKLFKKLFSQRQKEIEQKNKKIIDSIQSYENKFEYSLYLYENEKQYYQNLLKSHLMEASNFLRTKAEPSILWKPAKNFQKQQELRKSSVKMVEALLQANKKQCQEYYRQRLVAYKQKKQRGHHDDHDGDSHSQTPHKQEQD